MGLAVDGTPRHHLQLGSISVQDQTLTAQLRTSRSCEESDGKPIPWRPEFHHMAQRASPAMKLILSPSTWQYLGGSSRGYGGLVGSHRLDNESYHKYDGKAICLTQRIFTMGSAGLAGDELNISDFEFLVSWRFYEYGGLDGSHRLEDESTTHMMEITYV